MNNSFSISELITQLIKLPKYGQGVGLHRMQHFLAQEPIHSWALQIDAVKITGSNGKGSVSNMVGAILKEAGFHIGLYTSPHLFHFNERICVDGSQISDSDLQAAYDWVEQIIKEYEQGYGDDQYGAFETFTAIALYHFATQSVDTVVAEAGIGGRFDSTRIIPGNTTAITSLDLEHTQILGSTLELIAYEKADLCPRGGFLVVGDIDSEVYRRLKTYCALSKIHLLNIKDCCTFSEPRYLDGKMSFDLQYQDIVLNNLQLKLLGPHQINNGAVAVILAEHWLRLKQPNLTASQLESIIRQALLNLSVPGRLQKVWEKPEIYVDVGHTPDAIEKLVQSVKQLWDSEPILLVVGVSYNKDIKKIVEMLAPVPDQAICTRAWHRGGQVDIVANHLSNLRPELPIHRAETIEKAVVMAKDIAIDNKMKVLVAGGLFLSAEVIQVLQGKNPQRIQFF